MTGMKTRLFQLITSRWAIIAVNVIFIYFAGVVLWDFLQEWQRNHLDGKELEQVIEGMAVLSIAYGVALESREDIMAIFGLYPALETDTERRIDQVCKDYGIGLLLFGLFMEIPVQAVKVPDHIFITAGVEVQTLMVAIPFIFAVLVAGLLMIWRLLRLPPLRPH